MTTIGSYHAQPKIVALNLYKLGSYYYPEAITLSDAVKDMAPNDGVVISFKLTKVNLEVT